MSKYDILMDEMKSAMKAKDMVAVNAIRGIIAKVKDLTVNAGKEMTDEAVLAVIAKGVKQRGGGDFCPAVVLCAHWCLNDEIRCK